MPLTVEIVLRTEEGSRVLAVAREPGNMGFREMSCWCTIENYCSIELLLGSIQGRGNLARVAAGRRDSQPWGLCELVVVGVASHAPKWSGGVHSFPDIANAGLVLAVRTSLKDIDVLDNTAKP